VALSRSSGKSSGEQKRSSSKGLVIVVCLKDVRRRVLCVALVALDFSEAERQFKFGNY
jgi:hypothetical protein